MVKLTMEKYLKKKSPFYTIINFFMQTKKGAIIKK